MTTPSPRPADPARRARAEQSAARAEAALGAGRLREAAELAQRALADNPRSLRALMTLGIALRNAGQHGPAVEVLERAASVAPDTWQTHFSLAQTLHAKSAWHGRARAAYERAAELNPGFHGTHAALAKLCEEVNDLDGARAHADRALELAPDDPGSVLIAALVDRRKGAHETARDRLARVIDGADGAMLATLPPVTRALALRSYAATLDTLGEHARAPGYYARAHAERWSLPDAQRVDPGHALATLDASGRQLTDENLTAWREAPPADDEDDPAFLIGFPRSGTTLTEQILAAHPGAVTLDENTPLAGLMRTLAARSPTGAYADALPGLEPGAIVDLRAAYRAGADERLDAAKVGPRAGRLLIDKLPLTIMHLPLLARVFPRARLVVAIRDPRDACVSCMTQVMTPNAEMAHLRTVESAARFYALVMRPWLDARDRLPNPWIESRYEDLTANPERAIRRLTDFLGLAWDPAVLRFHEHARGKPISTPSYEAVASPITRASEGRWRHHASLFEPVDGVLDPFLDAFGYQR